jgi:hypothetical protein
MRVPPVGSLEARLLQKAAAALGVQSHNLQHRYDVCLFGQTPTVNGWSASHTAGGTGSVVSPGGGGQHYVETSTGGTDVGCFIAGRGPAYSTAPKMYMAGRITYSGTLAAGGWITMGYTCNGGTTGSLNDDNFYFGHVYSGSATNWVVAKGAVGAQTYIDTGVAIPAAGTFHDIEVWRNGSVVAGIVNGTPFSGNATGIGTSANPIIINRSAGNGGLTAARRLTTDWDFYAIERAA